MLPQRAPHRTAWLCAPVRAHAFTSDKPRVRQADGTQAPAPATQRGGTQPGGDGGESARRPAPALPAPALLCSSATWPERFCLQPCGLPTRKQSTLVLSAAAPRAARWRTALQQPRPVACRPLHAGLRPAARALAPRNSADLLDASARHPGRSRHTLTLRGSQADALRAAQARTPRRPRRGSWRRRPPSRPSGRRAARASGPGRLRPTLPYPYPAIHMCLGPCSSRRDVCSARTARTCACWRDASNASALLTSVCLARSLQPRAALPMCVEYSPPARLCRPCSPRRAAWGQGRLIPGARIASLPFIEVRAR